MSCRRPYRHEDIARLAYQIWEERMFGYVNSVNWVPVPGDADGDWYEAEAILATPEREEIPA